MSKLNKESIKEKVLFAMEQIRPFLNADGGDVEDFTEAKFVKFSVLKTST